MLRHYLSHKATLHSIFIQLLYFKACYTEEGSILDRIDRYKLFAITMQQGGVIQHFCYFRNWTNILLPIWNIFRSSTTKKLQDQPAKCVSQVQQSFHFIKSLGLKNLYIFLQTPSFYSTSKHNRLKENLKFSKQNFRPFLSFSLFLALKNQK